MFILGFNEFERMHDSSCFNEDGRKLSKIPFVIFGMSADVSHYDRASNE